MRTAISSSLVVLLIALQANAQSPGRDMKKEAAIWEKLQAVAPQMVETFKAATTKMDAEDYAGAIALYQQVVDAAPEFDPGLRRLGLCYGASNSAEKGLPLLEKAVTINPSPENLGELARLL